MTQAGASLAVIPARGGSKRIPQKNIRHLNCKPLLAYAIQAAQDSNLFGEIIVSTDNEAIANIARQLGAHVPFLRDPNLADDVTPVSAATADLLDKVDVLGQQYRYVCQLMPNCPLRTAADIVDSYRQFLETGAEAQISIVRYGWQNPWWAMEMKKHKQLDPVFKDFITSRSQDLPILYCPTGAVWWIKSDVLKKERTFHIPGKTGWEMSWQNGLDIDTQDDWALAEILFRLGFGKPCDASV